MTEGDEFEYRLVWTDDVDDENVSIGAVAGPEDHAVGVWEHRTDPANSEVFYGRDVVLQRRPKTAWETVRVRPDFDGGQDREALREAFEHQGLIAPRIDEA